MPVSEWACHKPAGDTAYLCNCQILQEAAVCQIHQHLSCLQPQHQINQGCQEIPEINRQLYTNGRAANSSHASNVVSKPQRSAVVLFNYLSGIRNVCFVPHLSWMSLSYTSHSMYFPDHLLCVKTIRLCWGALTQKSFSPPHDKRQQGLLERAGALDIRQAWVWILALPLTPCDYSQVRELSKPPFPHL